MEFCCCIKIAKYKCFKHNINLLIKMASETEERLITITSNNETIELDKEYAFESKVIKTIFDQTDEYNFTFNDLHEGLLMYWDIVSDRNDFIINDIMVLKCYIEDAIFLDNMVLVKKLLTKQPINIFQKIFDVFFGTHPKVNELTPLQQFLWKSIKNIIQPNIKETIKYYEYNLCHLYLNLERKKNKDYDIIVKTLLDKFNIEPTKCYNDLEDDVIKLSIERYESQEIFKPICKQFFNNLIIFCPNKFKELVFNKIDLYDICCSPHKLLLLCGVNKRTLKFTRIHYNNLNFSDSDVEKLVSNLTFEEAYDLFLFLLPLDPKIKCRYNIINCLFDKKLINVNDDNEYVNKKYQYKISELALHNTNGINYLLYVLDQYASNDDQQYNDMKWIISLLTNYKYIFSKNISIMHSVKKVNKLIFKYITNELALSYIFSDNKLICNKTYDHIASHGYIILWRSLYTIYRYLNTISITDIICIAIINNKTEFASYITINFINKVTLLKILKFFNNLEYNESLSHQILLFVQNNKYLCNLSTYTEKSRRELFTIVCNLHCHELLCMFNDIKV